LEDDVVCGEYRLETAVAELADGEQGAITEGREDMGVSSS
jgi:hypothetical protein